MDTIDGCIGDETLARFVARELPADEGVALRAHIGGCDACRELVAAVAPDLAAGDARTVPSIATDDTAQGATVPALPGTVLHARGGAVGRYVILDMLGRGGMGVVYRAYDPELDRRVAVKLVRADNRHHPGLRLRLVREAQAMARVAHRNVLTVHDAGTVGDEVYIAMALIDGGTLRHWLATGPRSRREILDRFIQAGRGLAAAHAAGLVHRDFKPDNVLVDGSGHVYVTDFGLARPSSSNDEPLPPSMSPGSQTLTQTGAAVGTPAFMAPEQMRGGEVDARADQFSFCVALYEALWGTQPFEAKDTAERLAAVERGLVPRRTGAPAWLHRIIARGLRAPPDERWPSMDALLSALAHDPARARRRWLAIAAAGTLLAVATGFVMLAVQRRHQHRDTRLAALDGVWNDRRREVVRATFSATKRQYGDESFSRASKIIDDYARAWRSAQSSAARAIPLFAREPPDAVELREACLDTRLAELRSLVAVLASADAETVARATRSAAALSSVRDCDDPRAIKDQLRLPADAETRRRVLLAQDEVAELNVLQRAGHWAQARDRGRALSGSITALAHGPTQAAYDLAMSNINYEARDLAGAIASARAAVLDAEATNDGKTAERAWITLSQLAIEQNRGVDSDEATAHAEAWVAHTGDERERARIVYIRARRFGDVGRFAEASALEHQAAKIARQIGDDDLFRQIQADLAIVYDQSGDHAQARRLYGENIRDKEAELGPHHPELAMSLNNFGAMLLDDRDFPAARRALERAATIYEDALGPQNQLLGELLSTEAELALAEGRLDDAGRLARRSQDILEPQLAPREPTLAYPLTALGEVALHRHQPKEAIAPLERALALRQAADVLPTDLAFTRMNLGFALVESGGDVARGRRLVDEARAVFTEQRRRQQLADIAAWEARHPRR